MAFDRLVQSVDCWIKTQPSAYGFAQVGPGGYQPANMEWIEFASPDLFRKKLIQADLVIAHAGMGSIISAQQYGKPIVILPRRANLRETRNDHQVATAKHFSDRMGIFPVYDEKDLPEVLASVPIGRAMEPISSYASEELLTRIKGFIHS